MERIPIVKNKNIQVEVVLLGMQVFMLCGLAHNTMRGQIRGVPN